MADVTLSLIAWIPRDLWEVMTIPKIAKRCANYSFLEHLQLFYCYGILFPLFFVLMGFWFFEALQLIFKVFHSLCMQHSGLGNAEVVCLDLVFKKKNGYANVCAPWP